MKNLCLAVALLLCAIPLSAQLTLVPVDPSGACIPGQNQQVNAISGQFSQCVNSIWTKVRASVGAATASVIMVDPTGPCSYPPLAFIAVNAVTGAVTTCQSGSWFTGPASSQNTGGGGNTSNLIFASTYNFTPQAPGGTLTATVTAVVNMTPCPIGVNATDTGHSLFITGGTGSPEAVLITGGNCTSGASTGQLIFTPANSHSGAWTIGPATGGLQESVCAMPTAGGTVFVNAAIALQANTGLCGKTDVHVVDLAGSALTGSFTILGSTIPFAVGVVNFGNNGVAYTDPVNFVAANFSGTVAMTGALNLSGSLTLPSTITGILPLVNLGGTRQGNTSVIQMAGTNSGVTGAPLCDDAGGNTTTSGCTPGFQLPTGTALQYLRYAPNVGNNTTAQFASLGTVNVNDYAYPSQTCNSGNSCSAGGASGASLTGGTPATLTMVPCPQGILLGSIWAPVYISGGTGGPNEAVTPTSGTCTSGAASGTIVFTPVNGHAGAFTLSSATVGWQEAANSSGANHSVYFPCSASAYTIFAGFKTPANGQVYFADSPDCVTITPGNGTNILYLATIGTFTDTTFRSLQFNGNFVNETYPNSTAVGAINANSSTRTHIIGNEFTAFGFSNVTYANFQIIITANPGNAIEIRNNKFWSIEAFEGLIDNSQNPVITGNISGTAQVTESNSQNVSWDTHAGGFGWQVNFNSNIIVSNNLMYGGYRTPAYTFAGPGITAQQDTYGQIANNYLTGLANGTGTISVTNGSGGITGTNTNFLCTGSPAHDLNQILMIEGDTTIYTITTCTSATSLVVTPVVARGSASGLRYQDVQSGDMYYIESSTNLSIDSNVALYSGDMGMDIATTATSPTGQSLYNSVTNNHIEQCAVCGMFVGGSNYGNSFVGNYFRYNGQRKLGVPGTQGAICFMSADGAGVNRGGIQMNYFSGNIAFDDRAAGTVTQKYFLDTDGATNSANFVSNIVGENVQAFTNATSGIQMYNPATPSVISQMFTNPAYVSGLVLNQLVFADLGFVNPSGNPPVNGSFVFCVDCTAANPCAGSGTGAFAKRMNGAWVCN